MGLLYDYAKSGGRELPASAGEVRRTDVPVVAATVQAGDGHQAAKVSSVSDYWFWQRYDDMAFERKR